MAPVNPLRMHSKQRKCEKPRTDSENIFKSPKVQFGFTKPADIQFGEMPLLCKPPAPLPPFSSTRPTPAISIPSFQTTDPVVIFNMGVQFGKTLNQQNQNEPAFFSNFSDVDFDNFTVTSQASTNSEKSGDWSLTEILNEIRSLNQALYMPTDHSKEDLKKKVLLFEQKNLYLIISNEILEEEKTELMLQLEEQEEEMEEFVVKLEETMEKLAETKQKVDSMKGAMTEFEQFKMLYDKTNIIKKFKKRQKSLKAFFDEIKSQLEATLEEKRNVLYGLEAEYDELKDVNNKLNMKLVVMKANYELQLKDAMHEAEMASSACDELQEQLAQMNTGMNQMMEELEYRDRDKDYLVAEYEAKLKSYCNAITEMEQSYDKLCDESFALTKDVAKLYFARKSALGKIKALECEKEKLESTVNNTKHELVLAVEKCNTLEAENQNLKEKVQVLQNSAESFKFIQGEISGMIASKEEFQLIVAQKDEVIADLTAKNKEYQETIEMIQAEKEGLYRSFQEMVTRADRVLSSKTTAVGPLKVNIRESEKENTPLKSPRKLTANQHQLAPIQPKTSGKSILRSSSKREGKSLLAKVADKPAPTAPTTSTRKRKPADKSAHLDIKETLLLRYNKANNKGKSKEKGVDMNSVKKSLGEEQKRPGTSETPKADKNYNKFIDFKTPSQEEMDLFLDIFA